MSILFHQKQIQKVNEESTDRTKNHTTKYPTIIPNPLPKYTLLKKCLLSCILVQPINVANENVPKWIRGRMTEELKRCFKRVCK